jgi:hypothetical protein
VTELVHTLVQVGLALGLGLVVMLVRGDLRGALGSAPRMGRRSAPAHLGRYSPDCCRSLATSAVQPV